MFYPNRYQANHTHLSHLTDNLWTRSKLTVTKKLDKVRLSYTICLIISTEIPAHAFNPLDTRDLMGGFRTIFQKITWQLDHQTD